MERQYFVYILTNRHHTVLYTGVTRNLSRRIAVHRIGTVPGFTSRYNLDKLIFYERASGAAAAITREKQIKAGPRRNKIALIAAINPAWRDLSDVLA